jgi:hypothetical protein
VEELLLFLLQLGGDLLIQLVLEILWEVVAAAYKATFGRPDRSIVGASIGYFVVGASLGGLSLLVWPSRLLRPGPVPGLSLILSPVCVGLTMQAWGRYRRARGRVTTTLATFPAGAAFALGTALVRFVWAR